MYKWYFLPQYPNPSTSEYVCSRNLPHCVEENIRWTCVGFLCDCGSGSICNFGMLQRSQSLLTPNVIMLHNSLSNGNTYLYINRRRSLAENECGSDLIRWVVFGNSLLSKKANKKFTTYLNSRVYVKVMVLCSFFSLIILLLFLFRSFHVL